MRAKKTKRARSIRYLLSANPKLERLSLRRLSAPVKNVNKRARSNRSPESLGARRALVLVAIFIAALGVLITARGPSRTIDVATTPALPATTPRVEAAAPVDAHAKADKTEAVVRSATPKTIAANAPVAEKTRAAEAAAGNAAAVAPAKAPAAQPHVRTTDVQVKTGDVDSQAKAPAAELNAKALAFEAPAKAEVPESSPVTITGCLMADEQTFWLKETTGVDAPKSRSWKWGFLKKRSVDVEVVDTSHTLKLANYVGQRITATGTLMNSEMRAHSLQRVATSCS